MKLRLDYHRQPLDTIPGYRLNEEAKVSRFVRIDDGRTTKQVSTSILNTLVKACVDGKLKLIRYFENGNRILSSLTAPPIMSKPEHRDLETRRRT